MTWTAHGQRVVDDEYSGNPFHQNHGVADHVGEGIGDVGANGRYS